MKGCIFVTERWRRFFRELVVRKNNVDAFVKLGMSELLSPYDFHPLNFTLPLYFVCSCPRTYDLLFHTLAGCLLVSLLVFNPIFYQTHLTRCSRQNAVLFCVSLFFFIKQSKTFLFQMTYNLKKERKQTIIVHILKNINIPSSS